VFLSAQVLCENEAEMCGTELMLTSLSIGGLPNYSATHAELLQRLKKLPALAVGDAGWDKLLGWVLLLCVWLCTDYQKFWGVFAAVWLGTNQA
jgi:hypothetical protein